MTANTGQGSFPAEADDRYLEDYVEGAVHEFGPLLVTEEEIIDFGRKFDPQVMHTDPEKAGNTIYGGLIASGWHTAGLFMRLYVEHYLAARASLGSPGVDELRWLKPVRPGDRLTMRVTVHKVRVSKSKPDRGVLHSYVEALNQEGQVVMTMMAVNLILRRRPAG